jgi:hypothetical protein
MNKHRTLTIFQQAFWLFIAHVSTPIVADSRFDELNIRTWNISANPHFFPEIDDPQINVPWLKDRPSFSIAFSGGGTRSATATLGALRALKKLGWIEKARYISANSGGSWALQPFIFIPKIIDDNTFLGPYIPPEKITNERLQSAVDSPLSMSSVIYNAAILDKLSALHRGDEAYSDIIGQSFLEPFGLHNKEKLFTFHDKALRSILDNNRDLTRKDFYSISRKRPYPIIVGSLRVPIEDDIRKSALFLIEATPLYTGVRNEFTLALDTTIHSEKIMIGGGYVESFGYDSYEPDVSTSTNKLWTVQLRGKKSRGRLPINKRYRFTLSDVIGMSGAAPAITIADKNMHLEVFPEFRHWAINRQKILNNKHIRNKAKELKHGDGADIDNLALMPLLTRKVENILVFINTSVAFPKQANCNNISTEILVDDVISLFRQTDKLKNNVVFDNESGKKLKDFCQGLLKNKKIGDPLIYCDTYRIIDNYRQAVTGGEYQPSICWAYLDRTDNWIKKIKTEEQGPTRSLINKKRDFIHFPHYQTINERKGKLINLNKNQVHTSSNLTAWSILNKKEYISEKMGKLPIKK